LIDLITLRGVITPVAGRRVAGHAQATDLLEQSVRTDPGEASRWGTSTNKTITFVR
jgi:hypothetical protein